MTKKNETKETISDLDLEKEEETNNTGEPEVLEETSEETSPETDPAEDDWNNKYLRLMADFQNYKKRSDKERSEIHAFANEKIVSQLLEVLDNFERALDHEADPGFKDGMVMIFDQFKEVLTKSGVEEIPAADSKFDPNLHNAVMMEDVEGVESGMVTQVLQKGYTLKGKVVRFSMVKVAN